MNLFGPCFDLSQQIWICLVQIRQLGLILGILSVQLMKRILTGTESIGPASRLCLLLHYLLNDTVDAFSNFLGLVFYSAEAGNFKNFYD